ncbi:small multi-drug export protein [Irregularibacter muris]|uniref:Small multi-drug export protein n=1 Tax=Irregularibacter muris TaxID=1796619 RepID=A0AAE3HFV2_9FIRM|nr:small multi-drug export protein [Irregularibacter muris]
MRVLLRLLKSELMVFLMAATPLLELRASLPYGIFVLDMGYFHAFILSVLGSILPAPFILWFLPSVLSYLKKKRGFSTIAHWITRRTIKKSKKLETYKLWGLFLLVAIPLPGTGVWTGSAVAALLRIPFKDALLTCFAGTIVAGMIILLLSYHATLMV